MTTRLETARQRLDEGSRNGLHLGGQLYVSLRGEVVGDASFGEIRPGEPLERDHLMLWLSATKPITAVAVARLWEQGRLELDDPVAKHVPEFGQRGKEPITLRHLLTHTGGIRLLDLGWPQRSWAEIVQRICRMKLEPRWTPGEKAGYHLTSSWFVLGEVVQRLSGESFARHVRRTIFEPLGMERCWIGMPEESYDELVAEIAPMFDTAGAAAGSSKPAEDLGWTERHRLIAASPGANGVGPLRQLGRLYDLLVAGGELDGIRLLSPQTIEAMTARHRVGLYDHTFRQKLDWGLGFVLDSRHYGRDAPAYGYGAHASRRVYGHSGYRSSTAFADPEHHLVVALAVNGVPDEATHRQRFFDVVSAIYEDLGLDRPAGSD